MFLFYTSWKQKTFRFSDVFRGCRKATQGCYGLSNIFRTRYCPVRAVFKAIFMPVDRLGAQRNKFKKQIKFWKLTCLRLKKKNWKFSIFPFWLPHVFQLYSTFSFLTFFLFSWLKITRVPRSLEKLMQLIFIKLIWLFIHI